MYQVEKISFHDGILEVSTQLPENLLLGTYRSETWTGTDKDEVVDIAGGDDVIDGGAGNDTVLIFANRSHFDIITLAGITKMYADGYSGANDYAYDTITLRNVESVQFADQTIS